MSRMYCRGAADRPRHDWLGYLQPTGLVVAPVVLDRLGLSAPPQGREDGEALAAAMAALEGGDAWPLFRDVLGWPADRVAGAPGGPPMPDGLAVSLRDGETLLEATYGVLDPPRAPLGERDGSRPSANGGVAVATGDISAGEDTSRGAAPPPPAQAPAVPLPQQAGGFQLLVRVEAPGVALDRRGALEGWEATPHQRFERLLRETGVTAGVLVGARETGRKDGDRPTLAPELRLVVAPKGETSGWIAWQLGSLCGVDGRSMLGGLKLLLGGHALFTDAPEMRLRALLAESRRSQANVSERLSAQVLAALHELLRGLDAADPALVRDVAARDPHHLYEGLLTVLMRLIFILYAEDRGLMPSRPDGGGASLYEQGYSLGGLLVRLQEDEAREADLMDERRGAWGRLLALFRLVERGHPSGFMQARGGKLFSEAAFPFLLGKRHPLPSGERAGERGGVETAAYGPSPRRGEEEERVLPVSDGCVLRVLDGLMTLGGERLSYRTLDVEQIGSVYEAVMGFTVERAAAPMLAIRAGRNNRVPVWVDLLALAKAGGAERAKLLKERTGRGQFPAAVAKASKAAASPAELEAALAPVVDARACPRGQAVGEGTPVLQPTDERRRTGSHYTPRSLTGPIVGHALEPAFARIGPDATPAAVLDLKVCDPAVGSGAFLVEACRQLGARLVRAWEAHPGLKPPIPADEDEDLHARRLVAQRCLYGVDRNPMALDLAKLSLWLATLARDHEFSFLDHALKAGDSLVGLDRRQIGALSFEPDPPQETLWSQQVRQRMERVLQHRNEIRNAPDDVRLSRQEAQHQVAERELERVRLIGDAVVGAFFAHGKDRARREAVRELAGRVGDDAWGALRDAATGLALRPFHWPVEFPEVFAREEPGFDAIVGNPPFAGKNTVIAGNRPGYLDWLQALHPDAHGNADLSAHFYRRSFALIRTGGAFGLIATNTIRQGDTRESGLRRIIEAGGVIYRAVGRHKWEGEAAVVVSLVFVRKDGVGPAHAAVLDGRPVKRISAYLVEGELDGSPAALKANAGKSFQGSILLGIGFTFDDVNAAKGKCEPLVTMERLIAADPRNADVIKPYLGGEEVNNSPTHTHHRYAIDFADWPLRRENEGVAWASLTDRERQNQLRRGIVAYDYPGYVAADWPDLLTIVERLVKPQRESLEENATNKRRREFWWQHLHTARSMYEAISGGGSTIAINCGAQPHCAFGDVPTNGVLANTLAVFALSTHAAFSTLQSRVHEVWARFFASSMKDDLRYTPSDCFETFPLPPGFDADLALEAIGQAYHGHRAALMVARNQGMTPTYNRFHSAGDEAEDIAELRRLHGEMDRAVLRAYGWADLAERAGPVFLDGDSEDDHAYRGRLFWPAPFRDELLARLLRLNEERAAAERMMGAGR